MYKQDSIVSVNSVGATSQFTEFLNDGVHVFTYTQNIPKAVAGPLKRINWLVFHTTETTDEDWLETILEISLHLLHDVVIIPPNESIHEKMIHFAENINHQINSFKPDHITNGFLTTVMIDNERSLIEIQFQEQKN